MTWSPEDEDPPTQRRLLSTSMCPCPDCETDDGAQTTELDPEDYQ